MIEIEKELTTQQRLQQESAEDYMRFVSGMFRKANAENKVKVLLDEILEEYLVNNRTELTLGGIMTAYREVHKSDNDLTVGLAGAISKGKSGEGSPLITLPDTPGSPRTGDSGSSGPKVTPEDIVQAKRVLKVLESIDKLKESEK
jgi:hypothetical protein